MNSATLGYQLPTFTGLVSHGWSRATFLRDASDEGRQNDTKLDLEAQVRSGDYFISLATTLDLLSRSVNDHHIRVNMEDRVSDLIYLQENYTIIKNKSSE